MHKILGSRKGAKVHRVDREKRDTKNFAMITRGVKRDREAGKKSEETRRKEVKGSGIKKGKDPQTKEKLMELSCVAVKKRKTQKKKDRIS